MSIFSQEGSVKYTVLSSESDQIITHDFLEACKEIIPVIDKLGSTAFAPVKSDINGNIERLQTKHDTDKAKYQILQSIVDEEIQEGTHTGKYSCTLGLLWLKRALEFIYEFLNCIIKNETDLVKCAQVAYESSLKKHHNFLVRGIFAVAVRAVPTYDGFMESLKVDKTITGQQVISEMSSVTDALKTNIDAINHFYSSRNMEI